MAGYFLHNYVATWQAKSFRNTRHSTPLTAAAVLATQLGGSRAPAAHTRRGVARTALRAGALLRLRSGPLSCSDFVPARLAIGRTMRPFGLSHRLSYLSFYVTLNPLR